MKKIDKIVVLVIALFIGFGFTLNFLATALFPPAKARATPRVILISIDSANPEYLSEAMMPRLFAELLARGTIYKTALTALASETQHGHTCMLTGAHPNNTGMIGNGYYNNETGETVGVVLDPTFRKAETIIEAIERTTPSIKTAFLSGKWRLPPLLANASDFIFASPITGIPLPEGYDVKVGAPHTFHDGDIVDEWIINALIELIRGDDPDFIFVNLAWTDVNGHYTGGVGDFSEMISRQLWELDGLFMRLFTELKAIGEYDNTLFVITSDHGMETVERVVDVEGYLRENGVTSHIHVEGGSGFVFLADSSDKDAAVNLLLQHPDVAVVVPRENMSQHPYYLDTFLNRTGHIYFSMVAHTIITFTIPGIGPVSIGQIGTHGGVALQDVVMAWMGPNITRTGYEITEFIPSVVDIVPTICHLTGWQLPAQTQGRVLYEILK